MIVENEETNINTNFLNTRCRTSFYGRTIVHILETGEKETCRRV
jgi:hypothetical protein